MSAAVGGAEFHGFGGAAQLPRSRMLGRPLKVAPRGASPAAGGASAASIRAVQAVSYAVW
jgi:sulfite reductase (ferredoxin)